MEHSTPGTGSSSNSAATQATAEKQQRIQAEQLEKDQQRSQKSSDSSSADQQPPPTQPGNKQPTPPLPSQSLEKPGHESEMQLKPRFEAPHYQGSGKLDGFVVLITGGDSGIGRAVAVLCAREGADVAIAYLNEHDDARRTCELIEAEGRRSLAIAGDVKNADFCKKTVEQVVNTLGKLNVLVNNAAFQEHAASLEELSEERFEETFRTNIFGYFHMTKAALPHLKAGDSIINTGSVTGIRGSKELLDYSATKGAIHAFTKAMAQNVADKGIRVNAVAPGPVWTPLNPADRPPEKIADFGKSTVFGRPAQPEEISPAYIFLASPCCSSYITGMVLGITGLVGEGG